MGRTIWALLLWPALGCSATVQARGDGGSDAPAPEDVLQRPDVPPVFGDAGTPPPMTEGCTDTRAADILFMVDNSNSMRDNQTTLARQFDVLMETLLSPSGATRAVDSLHVGVVSSDLGTPGSTVPSCVNSDVGDDGLLNPIRNGQSLRGHQPWATAAPGARPPRCTMDPNQYPNFMEFDANTTNATAFREDFVCNSLLSVGGCGLEQQLESAYRALVRRDARARPGNRDPNAGFVRDGAVLGVFLLTDEDDGSVRDCRYAEPGQPCSDAIAVFDRTSPSWAAADLNRRLYDYQPGSAQDPTWPLDRYIDPARPNRGFTSLKPGRPQLVVFGALTGMPLSPPRTAAGAIDYAALLGTRPDGSDGYVGMSPEGPISMRQANQDPACSTRVVPACRREGTGYNPAMPACDTTQQYYAWPSRRVVEVARRFEAQYGNGVVGSICAQDYTATVRAFAERVAARVCRR
ncbi:MAG: hypothetical protein R3A52_31875 [Polyangiales bacterium]